MEIQRTKEWGTYLYGVSKSAKMETKVQKWWLRDAKLVNPVSSYAS